MNKFNELYRTLLKENENIKLPPQFTAGIKYYYTTRVSADQSEDINGEEAVEDSNKKII